MHVYIDDYNHGPVSYTHLYAQWGVGEPNNDQGNEPRMGMMYVNGSWNLYDMPDDVSQYYSSNIVGFVMEKEVVQ